MSDIKTKFINDPEQITPELLEGYVLAYPDQVKLGGENIVVRANPKSEDKVAIVTLGGSGHEPAASSARACSTCRPWATSLPLPVHSVCSRLCS